MTQSLAAVHVLFALLKISKTLEAPESHFLSTNISRSGRSYVGMTISSPADSAWFTGKRAVVHGFLRATSTASGYKYN
jgi:hypothetical protein